MSKEEIIHNFNDSIIVGKKGEEIIELFIKNHPNVEKLYKVEDVKTFRDKDIDVVAFLKNGKRCDIEIKADTYTSGNIFYETISCVEKDTPGCMIKTQADFLFYYFLKTSELYIIKMKEYREWFNKNRNYFCKTHITNTRYDNSNFTSQGFLVPKTILERNKNIFKKYILSNNSKIAAVC